MKDKIKLHPMREEPTKNAYENASVAYIVGQGNELWRAKRAIFDLEWKLDNLVVEFSWSEIKKMAKSSDKLGWLYDYELVELIRTHTAP